MLIGSIKPLHLTWKVFCLRVGTKNHSLVPKFHFNQHMKAAKASQRQEPTCLNPPNPLFKGAHQAFVRTRAHGHRFAVLRPASDDALLLLLNSDRTAATRLPPWGLAALGTRGRCLRSRRAWSSRRLLVAGHDHFGQRKFTTTSLTTPWRKI